MAFTYKIWLSPRAYELLFLSKPEGVTHKAHIANLLVQAAQEEDTKEQAYRLLHAWRTMKSGGNPVQSPD